MITGKFYITRNLSCAPPRNFLPFHNKNNFFQIGGLTRLSTTDLYRPFVYKCHQGIIFPICRSIKDLLSGQMSFYGHPPRGPRVPFPPPGNYKTRSSCLIVISAPESSIPNLALRLVKVFYSSPLLTIVYNILSLFWTRSFES